MSTSINNKNPFQLDNIRYFIIFRICFNARFYYPVFTVLFLDYGLTLEQFSILNVIWAASIVIFEIPSGALADVIGRKRLVQVSGILMFVEMLVILIAPIGAVWTFYLFAINRILSGIAEAAASGADEALAYDTLVENGMADQWDRVLEVLMRWKSVAFVVAMAVGAAIYDASFLNSVFNLTGFEFILKPEHTLRLPILLTLFLSLGALYSAFRMRDASRVEVVEDAVDRVKVVKGAFHKTMAAGAWIWKTPVAFSIVLAGLLYDHVIRLILTINSEYMRLISFPEASFGIIAAVMSAIGIFTPKLSRFLVNRYHRNTNYLILGVGTAFGLFGMSLFWPYLGVLPMALLSIFIGMAGFFVSYYLNKVTDSAHRATVLSFRGLSFNLAYGLIGILYAWLVAFLRKGEEIKRAISSETENIQNYLFVESFQWILPYFLVAFMLVTVWIKIRKVAEQNN